MSRNFIVSVYIISDEYYREWIAIYMRVIDSKSVKNFARINIIVKFLSDTINFIIRCTRSALGTVNYSTRSIAYSRATKTTSHHDSHNNVEKFLTGLIRSLFRLIFLKYHVSGKSRNI